MKIFDIMRDFKKMMMIFVGVLGVQSIMTFLSIYTQIGNTGNHTAQTISLMILSITMASCMLLTWTYFREDNEFFQMVIWVVVLLIQMIFGNFIYTLFAFGTLYFNWYYISSVIRKRKKLLLHQKTLIVMAILLIGISGLFKYVLSNI